jgi:carboxypeptidase Taq
MPLKEWLNQRIHREGQRYRAGDLVARVTGEPLTPRHLLDHLSEKFGALYGI